MTFAKELVESSKTTNGDYLIIVKWNKATHTEYVVAFSWNPENEELSWSNGTYFLSYDGAKKYYDKKLREESML